MNFRLRLIALAAGASLLAACAALRTIVVEFDIDGTASIVDEQGRSLGAASPLRKVARSPSSRQAFTSLRYEGPLFAALLDMSTGFNSVQVENRSDVPLRLRFDQATLSSNLQPQAQALLVHTATSGKQFVHSKGGEARVAPALLLAPGATDAILYVPSFRGLYPSGRLFGVSNVPREPVLLETGAGNTLSYRIPVELGERRLVWIVELSARQASARSAYP